MKQEWEAIAVIFSGVFAIALLVIFSLIAKRTYYKVYCPHCGRDSHTRIINKWSLTVEKWVCDYCNTHWIVKPEKW